jgi:Fe-S cluster assembly iron-binding protein IscA
MTDTALLGTTTSETAHGVLLTSAAASKIKSLLEQEGRDDLRLRLAVQPGGCSGLIYQLYFDERLLDGATVDFEDTIQKQGFTIDNPNAQGSCACGDSFH